MKIACIMVLTVALIIGDMTLCMAESESIGIVKAVNQNVFVIT